MQKLTDTREKLILKKVKERNMDVGANNIFCEDLCTKVLALLCVFTYIFCCCSYYVYI